jgi:glutathione synthase/RimK-type ligase-like ATP-grasp enzyme
MTPKDIAALVAEVFRQNGSRGGKARAAALTPQRRKSIARKAAKARWAKARKQVA